MYIYFSNRVYHQCLLLAFWIRSLCWPFNCSFVIVRDLFSCVWLEIASASYKALIPSQDNRKSQTTWKSNRSMKRRMQEFLFSFFPGNSVAAFFSQLIQRSSLAVFLSSEFIVLHLAISIFSCVVCLYFSSLSQLFIILKISPMHFVFYCSKSLSVCCW